MQIETFSTGLDFQSVVQAGKYFSTTLFPENHTKVRLFKHQFGGPNFCLDGGDNFFIAPNPDKEARYSLAHHKILLRMLVNL